MGGESCEIEQFATLVDPLWMYELQFKESEVETNHSKRSKDSGLVIK